MAYQTRNWHAVETTDLVGSAHKLTVTGEIQLLKSNEEPALEDAAPQGFNPKILILDLTVSSQGLGGQVVHWKSVTYEKSISAHQYAEVTIRGGGETKTVSVEEVLS
jgi:hypothetical protein